MTMKTYTLFQQYIWLVNVLKKHSRLTLDEINEKWLDTEMSDGVKIARTTFNRHREAILDMFGIVIECNKKDGFRYFIENEEVLQEDTIQNWMLSTLSVNIILAESKRVFDRILLEQIPSDGNFLHTFIDAMKQSLRIKVSYKKYGTEEIKTLVVDPYFVKLFNKRWYAFVRFIEPGAPIFTLSFDRVLTLEATDEKFEYDKGFDPSGWFSECYGIMKSSDIPAEKVIIRAFGNEANFMRDLPLHYTQKIAAETESYTDFEMTLSPTPDFWTPLLSRGAAIKILQPQWLADEIKQQHKKALELYD